LVVSALGVMVTVERSTTGPGATVDITDPYRWLNRTVAVGIVVELSLEHIRYQVYALS
jgi:hypothetical protein